VAVVTTAEDPSIVRRYGPHRLPSPQPADGARIVMAGVDGTTTSLRAATYAFGLARREGCHLVVVHVMPIGSWAWAMPGGGATLQRIMDELDAELQAEIRHLAEEMGVPVSVVSRLGHPSSCLPEIADEIRADIVVVGASSALRRRFGGCLSTQLIRLRRWPVTVVP
jgi:nucleotide-binding universal stress UspA family protein